MRQAFDICKRVPSVSSFKSISYLRKEKRCTKLGLRSKECEWDQGLDCQVKQCRASHPHSLCFCSASGGEILGTKSHRPDLGEVWDLCWGSDQSLFWTRNPVTSEHQHFGSAFYNSASARTPRRSHLGKEQLVAPFPDRLCFHSCIKIFSLQSITASWRKLYYGRESTLS